ncbi:MAG: FHA domain-containing protein [Bradymonadia bacterium]
MAELIIKMQDREIKRTPITKVVTTIGRDEDQDIVIDNPAISRAHAAVEFDGADFIISDLGSGNGMFANGEPVKRWRLAENDHVQLGKFTVVFNPSAGPSTDTLIPATPAEPVATKPRRSPIATTSLSANELQKFREQAEREREQAESGAASAPAAATPSTPAASQPAASNSSSILFVGLLAGVAIGALIFYFMTR